MAGKMSKRAAVDELIRRGLSPRLLDLDLAAAYVGLCAEAFLKAVGERTYPPPLPDGRRRQWDRLALDAAIDRRSRLVAKSSREETPEDLMNAINAAP